MYICIFKTSITDPESMINTALGNQSLHGKYLCFICGDLQVMSVNDCLWHHCLLHTYVIVTLSKDRQSRSITHPVDCFKRSGMNSPSPWCLRVTEGRPDSCYTSSTFPTHSVEMYETKWLWCDTNNPSHLLWQVDDMGNVLTWPDDFRVYSSANIQEN